MGQSHFSTMMEGLNMYLENSIKRYLDDLAARKAAPGGGSAAALTASLGVSLMLMVANYTIGNIKYKAFEEKVSGILTKLNKNKGRLERLIDEDVDSYNRLSIRMKGFNKDAPELQPFYKEASDVPLEICAIAAESLKLCDELAECGNRNLVTDTAAAAIMLEGAFFSAKYNVYINLKFIKDLNYIEKAHNLLSPLEETMPKLKEDILEKCEDIISK